METAHKRDQGGAGPHHTSVAEFTIAEVEAELAQLRKEREAQTAGRWLIVEASKASGLSAPHLSRLCRTERLDAVLVNGAWHILPASLLEWVKRQ